MEMPAIKREIVAVLMESPFYFSIPLKKRLIFIKFFSQQPICTQLSKFNENLRCGERDLKNHNPTRY